MKRILSCALTFFLFSSSFSQSSIFYSGDKLSNPLFHDGRLSPVIGVHNIQVMRANRENPTAENGYGWTYNHQPMMAYWKGKFYMDYLSDPVGESVPPSKTFLMTSVDGYKWTNPMELFPIYNVPDGFSKPNYPKEAKNLTAIMHQRSSFYISKSNRLLAMGAYIVGIDENDNEFDGNGIGRVVREIYEDGTLGKIYFLYFNNPKNEAQASFPYYKKCKDKGFVKACEEVLSTPRCLMSWTQEAAPGEKLVPLNNDKYKAYCDYTLPNGKVIALWKQAYTSQSDDNGKTWTTPQRAKGFVNSNAKIWGQRLSDGTYATVYNPSEFRWPLAISLSKDGIEYKTLNLIHGEISAERYGGIHKNYGPQYVRGILEGNGTVPDGDLWLTYSMNKEDMWVSHVPVPVRLSTDENANDDFSVYKSISELKNWNIYSLKWAPVLLDGKWLKLQDSDPYDYSRVERLVPESKEINISFEIMAEQNSNGILEMEILDSEGDACTRITLNDKGEMLLKTGAKNKKIIDYLPGHEYNMNINVSLPNRSIEVFVDGKRRCSNVLFAPINKIQRVMFRTGAQTAYPTIDSPSESVSDLQNPGIKDKLSSYRIANFKTIKSL